MDSPTILTSGDEKKGFFYQFPSLPHNASRAQIWDWYGSVCYYTAGHGIFVPPLHTLEYNTPLGRWSSQLSAAYYRWQPSLDALLHQALTSKSTALAYTPLIEPLLDERVGHQLMWRIAQAIGHPLLSHEVINLSPPRQRKDDTLPNYIESWRYHLHVQFCRGIIYSDRYFVETFALNLHESYAKTLRPMMIHMVRRMPVNERVNSEFNLDNLKSYLPHLAVLSGTNVTLSETPRTRKEGKDAQGSKTRTVRSIESDVQGLDCSAMEWDRTVHMLHSCDHLHEDDLSRIYQVMRDGATSRTCDLCTSSEHLVHRCPRLKDFKDPVKARRLMTLINNVSSGRHNFGPSNGTPSSHGRNSISSSSSSSLTRNVNELTADDASTDLSASDTDVSDVRSVDSDATPKN